MEDEAEYLATDLDMPIDEAKSEMLEELEEAPKTWDDHLVQIRGKSG